MWRPVQRTRVDRGMARGTDSGGVGGLPVGQRAGSAGPDCSGCPSRALGGLPAEWQPQDLVSRSRGLCSPGEGSAGDQRGGRRGPGPCRAAGVRGTWTQTQAEPGPLWKWQSGAPGVLRVAVPPGSRAATESRPGAAIHSESRAGPGLDLGHPPCDTHVLSPRQLPCARNRHSSLSRAGGLWLTLSPG